MLEEYDFSQAKRGPVVPPAPNTTQITIRIDTDILNCFREVLAQTSRHLLAVYCYRQRLLSLDKAARLADLNRWDFIDLLAEHDVSVLNYSDDELAAEFAAVDQLDHA